MTDYAVINKITGKAISVGEVWIPFNTNKYELIETNCSHRAEYKLTGKQLCEIFRESIRPKYTLLQQVQLMKAASYLWDLIEVKGELTVDDYNEFREVLTAEVSSLTFVNMTELNELLDYIYLSNGFLGE